MFLQQISLFSALSIYFCLQRNRVTMKLQALFVLLLFTCMYMSLAQGRSILCIYVVIILA